MSDLLANVNALITQHLPQQVGAALQARLEQADLDAKYIAIAKARVKELEKQVQYQDQVDRLAKAVAERETAVAKREDAVEKREETIGHKEEIAKLQCGFALQRVHDMKDLTAIVFRSPVFKTSLSHHTDESVPVVMPGGYVNSHNKSRSVHTEEVTREEPTTPTGG